MIKPTVGRVVRFWMKKPADETVQPRAALIAHVWGDYCVNLASFDEDGNAVKDPPTSIRLVQQGEQAPDFPHCTWMPYQTGQQKKTEAAEAASAAKP